MRFPTSSFQTWVGREGVSQPLPSAGLFITSGSLEAHPHHSQPSGVSVQQGLGATARGRQNGSKKMGKKNKPEIFELAVENRDLERYDTNISKHIIEIEKKNKQVWNLKSPFLLPEGHILEACYSSNARENDRPLSPASGSACLFCLAVQPSLSSRTRDWTQDLSSASHGNHWVARELPAPGWL